MLPYRYKIGSFWFLSLTLPPPAIGQQLQIESRAGVNGTAYWKTGYRSRIFQVVSTVDVDVITANTLYRAYKTLIDDGVVDVVWNNQVSVDEQYKVVDVEQIDGQTRAILAATGATEAPGIMRCRWLIQALPRS